MRRFLSYESKIDRFRKTMMVAAPEQLSPTTINPETLEEGRHTPVRLLFQVKTIQP